MDGALDCDAGTSIWRTEFLKDLVSLFSAGTVEPSEGGLCRVRMDVIVWELDARVHLDLLGDVGEGDTRARSHDKQSRCGVGWAD